MRNTIAAANLSRNKLAMKQTLQAYSSVSNGQTLRINSPRFWHRQIPEGGLFPVIVKRLDHQGGKDMHFCHNRASLEWLMRDKARTKRSRRTGRMIPGVRDFWSRYYLEEFVAFDTEYRLWIAKQPSGSFKCFHIDIKRPGPQHNTWFMNHSHPETDVIFTSTNRNPNGDCTVSNYEIKLQGFRTMRALNLNIAAIDIGILDDGSQHGIPVVIESNTAPGITRDNVAALWRQHHQSN